MMDNFHVSVESEGREHFDLAMKLFFDKHRTAIGYRVSENHGLIFYWTKKEEADITELPYEMELEDASNFAWGWLKKTKYPPQPDHDGDNGKGFIVYNESWGHVDNEWEAFVAIKPTWAMYGK